MNNIKYLGVPLLVPPGGSLPSKGDTVKLLHGYNGGSLRGFQGLASICCSVLILTIPITFIITITTTFAQVSNGCYGENGCSEKEKKCFVFVLTTEWRAGGLPLASQKMIRRRIEEAKKMHSAFVKRCRTPHQQDDFLNKMKETLQLGVENYSQKIHSDTSISQELRNSKVATMDDYFGVNATR